jgi:hypothetical protein
MEKPFGWPEESVTLLCLDGKERIVTKYKLTEAVKEYRRKLKLSRKEIVKALGFTHKNEYVFFIRGSFDIESDFVKRVYNVITKVVECGRLFITLTYTETYKKENFENIKNTFQNLLSYLEKTEKPKEEGLLLIP